MCVRTNVLFVVCMYLSVAGVSCRKETEPIPIRDSAVTVRKMTVSSEKLNQDLNSFGTISYKAKNDVTVQVQGIVTDLSVKEGDSVVKGQRLATLKNVQLSIQKEQAENSVESAKAALFLAETKLEQAKLNVESRLLSLEKSSLQISQQELELSDAEASLENKRQLYEIGGITDAAFKNLQISVSSKQSSIEILKKEREIASLGLRDSDLIENGYDVGSSKKEKIRQLVDLNTRSVQAEIQSARAGVLNAEKSLDAVNKLVDELIIRSPSSGIVGARYFESGEFVPENEKIFTVMDISSVYAVFYIQEQDISNFAIGSPLSVVLPALGLTVKTQIGEISPMADPQSGNFTIKAELKNAKSTIKPGMFVKCTIPRRADSIYPVVPETALLQNDADSATVFTVINNFAVKKTVQIVAKKDGKVWISAGIATDDVVIDKPSPFLKEGAYVQ